MTQPLLSSLGPMLAASWRQRRNTGSMWAVGLVAALLLVVPAGLLAWSVYLQFGGHAGLAGSRAAHRLAAALRDAAATSGACALATLTVAWWATAVSNLLDQNRPVFARLVPRHPGRLRMALVVAWAGAVGLVTLLVGVRFDAPLLCIAAAGPAFTLIAIAVRWPLVWLLGAAAPLVVELALQSPRLDPLLAVVQAQWLAQSTAITLSLAAASVVVLMSLIQSGGRHHVASDAARRHRIKRFQMRASGVAPMGAVGGKRGVLDLTMSRPYHAWWHHVLARRGSPAFARLMLGLGPSLHWTSVLAAVVGVALAIFGGFVLIELLGVAWLPARDFAPLALAGISVGIVPALLASSMQVQARLHQTRREQALLVLLPGVPRGPALSRRLAWQLTGQFALALAGAVAVVQLCQHVAVSIRPDVLSLPLERLAGCFAIGVLPLFALQWRPWARVGTPSSLNAMLPMLLMALVMAGFVTGTQQDWFGETSAVTAIAGVAVAWCALRGWRMAREPASLPMGRLA